MSKLAPIKTWKAQHDAVIAMHLSGKKNIAIADELDLTPVRVSQIINDPQGQRIIEDAKKVFKLRLQEELGDRMLVLAELGSKRLLETMDEEFVPGSDAKKHQDNKAVDILRGTGFLDQQFADKTKDVGVVSNEVAKQLTDAIYKAAQAEKYKADIPTTDFELIEEAPSDG
jgi:hypothetical protein